MEPFAVRQLKGHLTNRPGGFGVMSNRSTGRAGQMFKRMIVVAACAAVSGCGTMLPGSIVSEDGKVIPFQIERAYRSGVVTATDPSTGENFKGNYVGLLERTTASESSVGTGQANYSGVQDSAYTSGTDSNFDVTSVGPSVADSQAFFAGDKGTTLSCKMKVETSIAPHGLGNCTDNKAKKYKLQF